MSLCWVSRVIVAAQEDQLLSLFGGIPAAVGKSLADMSPQLQKECSNAGHHGMAHRSEFPLISQ